MIATDIRVRPASSADSSAVIETLTRSFVTDPIFVWMLDDPATRSHHTRAFFELFVPMGMEIGTIDLADGAAGAGLWLPVDPAEDHADESFGEQLAAACGPHIERLGIIDELMQQAHPKDRAHAYLNFLGTLPESQGQGIGGALLAARLRELDAAGTPAYLEATTLRSAALYSRHGFRHLPKPIEIPGGPSMYPMWREPAGA